MSVKDATLSLVTTAILHNNRKTKISIFHTITSFCNLRRDLPLTSIFANLLLSKYKIQQVDF